MADCGFTFRDLLQFSDQLRSERLFILSEQNHLQELNSKMIQSASQLAQLAWIKSQQRINLDRLILAKPDCSPDVCCLRANTLDQTQFIDAYKVLGYQESTACGKLFNSIRQCPKLLAACLAHMDRVSPDKVPCLVNCIISGLYANCLIPQDELNILIMLRHLTILQLLPSEDPRRLLRHNTCAFSQIYSAFLEGLFSAKVFLTAALHEPIMKLLMEDDNFLDIDPDKACVRVEQEIHNNMQFLYVGNASDNQDLASEAASNHSASSLELENDNLSDMVSANVSGRGSPNISGRDTPSSQVTEGDEAAGNSSAISTETRFVPPPPPVKQPRFDLDDKFGKFEIKTIIGARVLSMGKSDDSQSEGNLNRGSDELEAQKSDETDGKDIQEKRTRFSLDNTNGKSHDGKDTHPDKLKAKLYTPRLRC
ncbi:GTPase-activating protein and VPS9 domain-containing protein 1-like [Diaphorina citri]|uniref:GTPase-activating protein and VPS9 domain-containing protein 1-like n=1 Tax=Diaphorina citri TaxID=121845 RepID=A0A3Q0JHM9_DIACI|nr:GTPase-activating protein and VPS9 domain-containing protein 1-like [Diaphorina citri]